MKQYRVFRVSVMEPCGGPLSTLKTCVREFDTVDDALECINTLRTMFPKSYVMDSGNLGRSVDFIHHKSFNSIDFDIVHEGSVFWMILEHGEGLPMPIRIQ